MNIYDFREYAEVSHNNALPNKYYRAGTITALGSGVRQRLASAVWSVQRGIPLTYEKNLTKQRELRSEGLLMPSVTRDTLWWSRRVETSFGVDRNLRDAITKMPVESNVLVLLWPVDIVKDLPQDASISVQLTLELDNEVVPEISLSTSLIIEAIRRAERNENAAGQGECAQTELQAVVDQIRSIQRLIDDERRGGVANDLDCGYGVSSYSMATEVGFNSFSSVDKENLFPGRLGYLAVHDAFSFDLMKTFASRKVLHCDDMHRWILRRVSNLVRRALSYTALPAWQRCWNFGLNILREGGSPGEFLADAKITAARCVADRDGRAEFAKRVFETSAFLGRLRRRVFPIADISKARSLALRNLQLWEQCADEVWGVFDRKAGLRVGRRCKRDADCRWDSIQCMRGFRREDEQRYDGSGFCAVPRGAGAVRVLIQCVYERLGKRIFTSLKFELLGKVESNKPTPSGAELIYSADSTNTLVNRLFSDFRVNLCVGPKTIHALSPSARDFTQDSCHAMRACNWNLNLADANACESINDEPSFCGISTAVTWALQQGHRSVCRVTNDVDGLIGQSACRQAYSLALEAEHKCIALAKTKVEADDCYTLSSVHSIALLSCMRQTCGRTTPTSVNFDNEACGITGRDSASLCMDECRSVSAPSPVSVATCYRAMQTWETDRDCYYSAAGDTRVFRHIDEFNERLTLDSEPDFLSRPRYCSVRVYLAGRTLPHSTSTSASEKAFARQRAFNDMQSIGDILDTAYQMNMTLTNDLSEDVIYEVRTEVINGSRVRRAIGSPVSVTPTFTASWQGCPATCTCDCTSCTVNGDSLGYLCSSEVIIRRQQTLEDLPICSECQTCCSDFCAHQRKCEIDNLFFPQIDNSSFTGTNRAQPVASAATGEELRVIDTLSECNRAFGGRKNVTYDALAPWAPSSPTLNRFEADKCLSFSGVCLRGLGLTPTGLSASNKAWEWSDCFQVAQETSVPSGGRRLTAVTNDPPLSYPSTYQNTLTSKGQVIEWDATLTSGQGACLYRKPDPFELFGGVTPLADPLELLEVGWPAAFDAAGETIKGELGLSNLPAGNPDAVNAWKATYVADQTCPANSGDDFTEYTPSRFWLQGQNNDQDNCEAPMCDMDPKVNTFDECSGLEGCSTDCWTCASTRSRNQEQGLCVLEDPSISRTTCEHSLKGVWVQGKVLNPTSGDLEPAESLSSPICALIHKSVQFCVSKHERVVRCADFGSTEVCEQDSLSQLLNCAAKEQKCRRKEDCVLAGTCESDTVDGLFSSVQEYACIVHGEDPTLAYYELCDEALSVCFLPLASGLGMHVVDLGELVDFNTQNFLFAGVLGRARSGHKFAQTGGALNAAVLQPMTEERCGQVAQNYPHLRTAFLTRPRTRLQCEALKACCVRLQWGRCTEFAKVETAPACDERGGVWQSVWQWTRRGTWKPGSIVGNANRQWQLRRFTNINSYSLELDRTRVKNKLFTAFSNSLVNEYGSEILRERLEPLIVSLGVLARICGAKSSKKEFEAAMKTSLEDEGIYGLNFAGGVFRLRAGLEDSLLPAFGGIRVSHGSFLMQDTTPPPTASLLNDTLISNLPALYLTVHPVETLLFGNAANQFALPSRFKYLTAKRLAYLASIPQPPSEPGVNISVPTWNLVGGSVSYPTAVLEWMVRVANPYLYTTTPAPILSEDEQKRQQELTAQVLDSDAKLYWTYNASFSTSPADPIVLHTSDASACSNAAVNSQGVVVGQLAGDCVSLSLSETVNTRNPIEICWPVSFEGVLQVRNDSLLKLDVAKLVIAARAILQTDAQSGIAIPDDIYGLMRVGNAWVEPLGRRIELRANTFCSHYLVNEDAVICPIRRTSNNETFPEIFSDETTELPSSCNFIEPFLDAVQAEHKISHDTRSYTPLASQQQASFDRYHDGVDVQLPEVKYEFVFVEGPSYQPKHSFAKPLQISLAILTMISLILIH